MTKTNYDEMIGELVSIFEFYGFDSSILTNFDSSKIIIQLDEVKDVPVSAENASASELSDR